MGIEVFTQGEGFAGASFVFVQRMYGSDPGWHCRSGPVGSIGRDRRLTFHRDRGKKWEGSGKKVEGDCQMNRN